MHKLLANIGFGWIFYGPPLAKCKRVSDLRLRALHTFYNKEPHNKDFLNFHYKKHNLTNIHQETKLQIKDPIQGFTWHKQGHT